MIPSHAMEKRTVSLPIKIAESRCDSCIFSNNTPISPKRFRQLVRGWGKYGHQICHKFGTSDYDGASNNNRTIEGEDVYCRGFYENMEKFQGRSAVEVMDTLRANGLVVEVPFPLENDEPLEVST